MWEGSAPRGGMTSAVSAWSPASIAHWSAVVKAFYRLKPTTMQDWTCSGLNMQPKGLTMSSGDTTDPLDISLSAREIEIIQLVAEGLTNQEIADRLTISKRTVDNHVSNVFTKTGSKNRVALLNWSMDNGKICRDGFNCCALPDADPHEP